MKRHLFLTGGVQVGKSTLIEKILESLPGLAPGGFRTLSAGPDAEGTRAVYLLPAAGGAFGPDNRVGLRTERGIVCYPAAFDTAGVAALAGAEKSPLILMDEIGRMEREADLFSARVRALADGKTPILGVVQRQSDTPLAEYLRGHAQTELVEVTRENRDALLPELQKRVKRILDSRTDSGGAIAFRGERGREQVLLVRMGRSRIAFPKGHLEPGESAAEAALRETREETGVSVRLLPGEPLAAPSARADDERTIWFFPAVYESGEPRPQPGETAEAFWEDARAAEARLTFGPDREALLWALGRCRAR
jgi:nucleoside-triphosphatase THEP1/ADP-ribose pyrophosphatase YjhB (NUDIX family)